MIKKYSWLLLSVTLAVFILILALPYIRQGQIGSFEYVRKGEELFHKGKVKEAIRYFEKAYASSPENRDIITNLLYAYSEYSAAFAEAKDYDKAIEYMSKACDVELTSSTVQNLAIMYSKRSIAKAVNDDLRGARKDFEKALEAASSSGRALRNFSVSLYNDAIYKAKEGKNNLAIVLLKESSLAYPNALTFESLGDVYYKKTDFDRARFYYGKAMAFEPKDRNVRERLQKAIKELELARREESKQSPHFELRYDKNISIDADSVKKVLERCYIDVGGDLKYFPDSKTIVFLYSHDDFRNIFKMPSVVRAFYDGNIRIPLPEIMPSGEELSSYIYHEYTHAVVSAKTNNNCPVWLSEGLAVWEEYKDRNAAMVELFNESIYEIPLLLGDMDKAFKLKDNSEEDLRSYYLLAYSVVKYIVDNWGIEGMRNILIRIRDGQHIINAIDDEFLLSEKEFEKRWQRYVLEKYLKQAKSGIVLEGTRGIVNGEG